ncbi:MAG: AbrB/MazE/SpoVT family DNA-binding domain-containing protein [Bradymonadaceae bacterium]
MGSKTVKLSSRGQLVIPAELRRALDLERGTRLEVELENGHIVLTPIREEDWQSYRGFLADGSSLTRSLEKERRDEREKEEEKMNVRH